MTHAYYIIFYLYKYFLLRFPDAHCRSCIVQLMDRIGRAYKKPDSFIMDLMNIDIPGLMNIDITEDDPNVEQLFVNMLRLFMQRNALNKVILYQVQEILVIDTHNYIVKLEKNKIKKEVGIVIKGKETISKLAILL